MYYILIYIIILIKENKFIAHYEAIKINFKFFFFFLIPITDDGKLITSHRNFVSLLFRGSNRFPICFESLLLSFLPNFEHELN